ncbi:hypothetical protein [Ruegeria arenilitoris]|uniref:hypothetical protein n=1 Tax=Ruegeria arenilitoris TaxID=1173585 RepID=UPI00147BE41A|nr:hypothetical protein [Ruegeria arenilitoris]
MDSALTSLGSPIEILLKIQRNLFSAVSTLFPNVAIKKNNEKSCQQQVEYSVRRNQGCKKNRKGINDKEMKWYFDFKNTKSKEQEIVV